MAQKILSKDEIIAELAQENNYLSDTIYTIVEEHNEKIAKVGALSDALIEQCHSLSDSVVQMAEATETVLNEVEKSHDNLERLVKLQDDKMKAMDDYRELILEELREVSGLAIAHGWQSSRYEAGVEARAKIAGIEAEINALAVDK